MAEKTPKDYGLNPNDMQMDSVAPVGIDSPYDLAAEDFLRFAQEDIRRDDERHLVNALSNTKRAIENRASHLLLAFGCHKLAKRNFPEKFQHLNLTRPTMRNPYK